MTDRDASAAIVDAVRAAAGGATKLRVRGGGTSAVAPRDGATWLDVAGHRGLIDLRPVDGVVEVRAGTPLAELDAALREAGRRTVLRPWDPETGTIGGAVAAAADGVAARGGARWRDHVLGVRAVLGTGDVVFVGARVVKSVAGFDVAKALVGSRGTLAVLLDLVLRIEPVPEASEAFATGAIEPAGVHRAVVALDGCGLEPAGRVVTPAAEPGRVIVEALLEGPRAAVADAGARLAASRIRRAEPAAERWRDLARIAAQPAPEGLSRRVVPGSRRGVPGDLPASGWIADLVRRRVVVAGPPDASVAAPATDSAGAALFERVRRAFDPESVLQPGRGFGAA